MPSHGAPHLPKPVTRNPRGEAVYLGVNSTLTMRVPRLSAATSEVRLPGLVLPHTTAPRRQHQRERRAVCLRGTPAVADDIEQTRREAADVARSLGSIEFGKSGGPTPSSEWPLSRGHAAGPKGSDCHRKTCWAIGLALGSRFCCYGLKVTRWRRTSPAACGDEALLAQRPGEVCEPSPSGDARDGNSRPWRGACPAAEATRPGDSRLGPHCGPKKRQRGRGSGRCGVMFLLLTAASLLPASSGQCLFPPDPGASSGRDGLSQNTDTLSAAGRPSANGGGGLAQRAGVQQDRELEPRDSVCP